MASNTAYPSVVADDIQARIDGAKATILPAQPIQDVFYGDQRLIPRTPSVCVEPGPLARDLNHTGFATDNDFTIFVLVYHAKIQDDQVGRRECMQLAEAIMDFLHVDKQLGGLVYNGFVASIDPGFASRGGTFFKVTRLTWAGRSKTIL